MAKSTLPTYGEMMAPVVTALISLGGSGTIEEIDAEVAKILNLTDDQLEIPHNPSKGGKSEFSYRLAWSRTYLKKASIVENSSRGVWALIAQDVQPEQLDVRKIARIMREQSRLASSEPETAVHEAEVEAGWREELQSVLLSLRPDAFERLVQRVLRESGFVQVEVTGRSGDGGIDGRGIMRLGGLLSFHVIFQCKRWQGSVGSSQIRDFRGSMVGRADKGLFVTTSTFTPDAVREATRDGAPPIDLVDGEELIDKLKELRLGVKSEMISYEQVTINQDWFTKL